MRPFFCIVPNSKNFMFMKKISLFTLAALASLTVLAQNTDDKAHKPIRTEMSTETRFGIKAGVNMATIEIDDDSQSNEVNTNNKTSFHAGLFVNIPLGDRLAFQPEVVYSGQGSKVSYSNDPLPGTTKAEWDFHYVNIPLMLQAKVTSGLFFEAGPQIGFLLKAEQDEPEVDLKEQMKKTDFGAGVGLGYLSRIGLGLNARYNFGFSNIYDADADDDEGKLKNRVLNIGLVYHFGAHK